MIRTSSTHVRTWYLFSEALKGLYKQRQTLTKRKGTTDFQIASINSSILLHLSAILEGAVNSLMYTKLISNATYDKARNSHDMEIVRLFRNQMNTLQRATWHSLNDDIAKTILGFPLSNIYKQNWSAIKYLIEFRNILAHGGLIVRSTDKISTDEVLGPDTIETTEEHLTKKELFKYLHSKNLIPDTEKHDTLNWKFINSEVADFFHLHVKAFLTKLYEEYTKKNTGHFFLENDQLAISRM